jgi:hypothetical protein
MRIVFAAACALGFAILGPRLTRPHDRSADAPFVYEPPEGFVPDTNAASLEDTTGDRVWTFASAVPQSFVPKISLTHTPSRWTVEEPDLAKAVTGMPDTFEEGGVTWTHRRHETRTRADGAHVGLIEGDCVRDLGAGLFGAPPTQQHFRTIQLLFPDDAGTTIVKAYYATSEAAKWEPAIEATIDRSRGVATRLPGTPATIHLAWAVAGLVLGWLGFALYQSRPKPA